MKWETCTEKPIDAALITLPISHVVDSTKPILAEASAPRCPTMEASMKNIMTVVIWANIEGILKLTISLSFSFCGMGWPLRMFANSASLFLFPNIPYFNDAKLIDFRVNHKKNDSIFL